ncbi:uncharacterized protein LOC142814366 [Rhipicephalus microplus]|uniref:uncharacterized protein LOC142814366 n=1 Tax=Rhipicephalus microplus TaxID=6941 RepID=UPI003F6D4E32
MNHLGLPEILISTVRRMYRGNTVVAHFGDVQSDPIVVVKGLRQGCPLSPLLYILYVSSLERRLLSSSLGFRLHHTTSGIDERRRLPGLTFADDIVLMAESTEEMQALLDICQDEITRLGLCFNVKKTALLRLVGEYTKEKVVTLGDAEVSSCTEYRYLGVKLSTSTDMYSLHEAKTREAGLRAQSILRRRCLWGCNRYLMVRDLWKLVHVPGLTFANAVVVMSAAPREWLERRQREVGRIALGCHGMVANEAVQGDIGWSSFEAREAASKLTFHCRLMYMSRERWSRRVFDYLMATCMRTKWVRRVYQLEKKFGFFQEPLTAENQRGRTKEIRQRIKEAEEEK